MKLPADAYVALRTTTPHNGDDGVRKKTDHTAHGTRVLS